MIPDDALSGSCVHHRLRQVNHRLPPRSSINQVTDKGCSTLWVPPDAMYVLVFQVREELDELIVMPVDITDDVNVHFW